MRRLVAGGLVAAGLIGVLCALYLDPFVACITFACTCGLAYGLAGYDLDAKKQPSDGRDW